MNISRFFIDRPIFAGVLSALILLAGLLSLPALPISEYPEVAPPIVTVRALYPGANPKVIIESVATPLEEQINGVVDDDEAHLVNVTGLQNTEINHDARIGVNVERGRKGLNGRRRARWGVPSVVSVHGQGCD